MADLYISSMLDHLNALFDAPTVKSAFVPAPAVEQAVMQQAQAGPGGPPPGGDPNAPPPGAGGPPTAGPPGAPPGAPAGPPGAPPGDPAAAGAAPPQDPNASFMDAVRQVIRSELQQQQQQGVASGASGAGGGKSGKDALHQTLHGLHTEQQQVKRLLALLIEQNAEMTGKPVPLADLMSTPPPPMPGGAPAAPAPDPAAAAAAPAPGGGGGGGMQGPPVSVGLPPLPSLTPKVAADLSLHVGTPVGRHDCNQTGTSTGSRLARLVAGARR